MSESALDAAGFAWWRGSVFFSSRRRHTICSRDWSSDVCSSDLLRAIRSFVPLAVLWIGKLIIDGVIGAARARTGGVPVDWWHLGGLVGLELGIAIAGEGLARLS